MTKKVAVFFIICILLTSCNKKEEQVLNSAESAELLQVNNYNIEDISYFIFTDLKLKWEYNNLVDLFESLKFSKPFITSERIIENIYLQESFIRYYNYECVENRQYKVSLYTLSYRPDIVSLASIEIELDEENYLDMFPYKYMYEYMENSDFGAKSSHNQGENNINYYMRYKQMIIYGDDRFGNSDLIFNNNLLKSIRILAASS